MKVKQLHGKNGPVKNQFEIWDDQGNYYFQSYDSIIYKETKEGVKFLDVNTWDYSVTTGKYRNMVLGENKTETEKKIKEGVYKLMDLNS